MVLLGPIIEMEIHPLIDEFLLDLTTGQIFEIFEFGNDEIFEGFLGIHPVIEDGNGIPLIRLQFE